MERFMKQLIQYLTSHHITLHYITLRDINLSKKTAVCGSMHGDVRGRGSNLPTCLILALVELTMHPS